MNLPNLLVVGAQKAGTTSLFDLLKDHPDFYLPIKEVKFFHRHENYALGLEWYADHFKDFQGERYIGDFTPDYMAYSWTAERIHQTLGPKIKIVFILRDPVLRSYSQFNFYRMNHVESENDFQQLLDNEQIDLKQNHFENWYIPANYISRSIYTPQIQRFLDFYSRESIQICIFEEVFIEQSKKAIEELEVFLGLSLKEHLIKLKKKNESVLPKNQLVSKAYKSFKAIVRPIKNILQQSGFSKSIRQLNQRLESNINKKPEKLSKEKVASLKHKYFETDIEQLEVLLGRKIKAWQ